MALFPLIKPTTCDPAHFGGIEINMCSRQLVECFPKMLSWPLGGGQHEWDDPIRKTCLVRLLES